MTSGSGFVVDGVEVFPPTLREVLLRPRWMGVLALCLIVAAVFAWLGKWQLESAIDTDPPPPGMTEQMQPLEDIVGPGEYLPGPYIGQRVEVAGEFVSGDYLVVADRLNDGEHGFWVTGQFRVADTAQPTALAVALGWAPTRDAAQAAVETLSAQRGAASVLTGRIIADEGPALPPRDGDPFVMTRMSPTALLSQWSDIDGLEVYRAFLVSEQAPSGLETIVANPPAADSPINALNLFYAIEWAIFAGFAFYIWYRLAKDAWEKEVEELEDAAGAASA